MRNNYKKNVNRIEIKKDSKFGQKEMGLACCLNLQICFGALFSEKVLSPEG